MQKPSDDSQASNFRWITIEDFEFLCFRLAKQLMTYSEPIPDFSTVKIDLLKSALGNPQQGTIDGLLYPTLSKQTAILFYSLIKNHAFDNGNKRIAVMAMFVFISLNGKWIEMEPTALYELALKVSNSNPKDKQQTLEEIELIIGTKLVDEV